MTSILIFLELYGHLACYLNSNHKLHICPNSSRSKHLTTLRTQAINHGIIAMKDRDGQRWHDF